MPEPRESVKRWPFGLRFEVLGHYLTYSWDAGAKNAPVFRRVLRTGLLQASFSCEEEARGRSCMHPAAGSGLAQGVVYVWDLLGRLGFGVEAQGLGLEVLGVFGWDLGERLREPSIFLRKFCKPATISQKHQMADFSRLLRPCCGNSRALGKRKHCSCESFDPVPGRCLGYEGTLKRREKTGASSISDAPETEPGAAHRRITFQIIVLFWGP